jgi:pimeloyl-ACP methyl ester carboxylesterase
MPYITLNHQKIFYSHQPGPAERPTLLLIHGAGGRHLDWPAKVRFLPETTVYALDLPGHAQSEGPGRDTIDAYADDVAAFMEAVGLERVVLVGHSMGGAIALTLALRRTPQVVGLVLVGTSARLRVGEIILDNILPNFPKALDLIFKFAWSSQARPVQVGLAKRLMRENGPEVVYGDFWACHHFDVRARLGEITLPTLVLSGAADQMTPAKFGQALAAGIPGAKFVVIDRVGHFLMQEAPERVAGEIKQFLARNW